MTKMSELAHFQEWMSVFEAKLIHAFNHMLKHNVSSNVMA